MERSSGSSWRRGSLLVLWAWACAGFLCPTPPAGAEPVPGDAPRVDADCRFNPIGNGGPEGKEAKWSDTFLPDGDVFRPMMADPKQPQIFAVMQSTKARDANTTSTVGSVSFGENFGLWSRRKEGTCNGFQVGILTGVFSQFNVFDNTELINTDFVFGVPFSWRSDLVSARVRLYHQSSHLGDEFLLERPGFNRVDYSFEEVEAIVSWNTPGGGARVYGGGGYLVHVNPNTINRLKAQWGVEFRGPEYRAPLLDGATKGGVKVVPVFGADFKVLEELHWALNTNLLGGFEWFRAGATRRLRILLSYYRGYNPYGQFFSQKVENVGIGLYMAF